MISAIAFNSWLRKKIIVFLILLLIPVVVLEIWAVNRLATFGSEISKLENIKQQLLLENEVLGNEIADQSSLFQIQQQSKEIGFEKGKNFLYLQNPGLALNH